MELVYDTDTHRLRSQLALDRHRDIKARHGALHPDVDLSILPTDYALTSGVVLHGCDVSKLLEQLCNVLLVSAPRRLVEFDHR